MAKKSKVVDASEFVTQAEAATLRKKSLASINELVRRGRLRPVKMFGRNLLRRSDVLSFESMKTGPKPATKSTAALKRKRGKKK